MSTTAATVRSAHGLALPSAARDGLAVAGRNLTTYRRVPQLIIFATLQPIVFVLMFRYVFSGVISNHLDVPYVEYLMPGIYVQTIVFGSLGAAVGMATDMQSGLIERFRSLPMARSAVLAGRTLADLTRNVFVVALMVALGFVVGFRLHTTTGHLIAGVALVLLFGYSLSWVFVTVGLLTGNPETAQAAAFPLLIPLVFASSAFLPVATMPGWLQAFANHQPVSVTASAVRGLVLGGPAATYIWQTLAWCAGIVAVFAPLAVYRYRRAL